MKRLIVMSVIVLVTISAFAAKNKKNPFYPVYTPEQTEQMLDSIVPNMRFQFQPNSLNGQMDGSVGMYEYRNLSLQPLWLLTNMGGAVYISEEDFTCRKSTKEDGKWMISLLTDDTKGGRFDLQFVIDTQNGSAQLKLLNRDTGREDMFEGNIYPLVRQRIFKNDTEKERITAYEQTMDKAIRGMDFNISGGNVKVRNSHSITSVNPEDVEVVTNRPLEGETKTEIRHLVTTQKQTSNKGRMTNDISGGVSMQTNSMNNNAPDVVPSAAPDGYGFRVTPEMLKLNLGEVVCCFKQGDMWYVRILYRPDWDPQRIETQDFAVNVLTGEAYQRFAYHHRLPKNWMQRSDGRQAAAN